MYTDYLLILDDSMIQGFPLSPSEVSYEDLLLPDARDLYYDEVEKTNVVRNARLSALIEFNQLSGIAIGHGSHDNSIGSWQVSFDGDTQLYVDLEDVLSSPDQLLLLNLSSHLRWLPHEDYFGESQLEFRAWDGVLPPSIKKSDFFGHKATIIDRTSIGPFNIGSKHHAKITVNNIPDIPVITLSTAVLSPLPYTLKYHYDDVFTIIVTQEVSSMRPDKKYMENLMHLIFQEPVAIHRVYSATEEW